LENNQQFLICVVHATTYSQETLYTILKTRLTIILTLIGFLTFAQENKLDVSKNKSYEIEAETLDSLYVRALNNRFDLILQSGWQYVEIVAFPKNVAFPFLGHL